MRWDIFCKVVDNFGDMGVCWRLSRDLAARGAQVRLWTDDASPLRWMAPEVLPDGSGAPGIVVMPWRPDTDWSVVEPGDVVIEAFGCDLPDDWVARMQRPTPPAWINLEYLSAEGYVERSHGLPSPLYSGPGAGLVKRFFYPGFTTATGGLIREPGLLAARDALQASPQARAQCLSNWGVDLAAHAGANARVVTLFCYDDSPVGPLLDALNQAEQPCAVLLTPGHAAQQGQAWRAGPTWRQGRVSLHPLPALPQPQFDRLLWCSDLNLVRGEDSAVRALWAGRPHVWQIYRQDDGVHAQKLIAFMDRWMADWPTPCRAEVTRLWLAFNGLAPASDLGPALQALWQGPNWQAWQDFSQRACQLLAAQNDLVSQLLDFVAQPG